MHKLGKHLGWAPLLIFIVLFGGLLAPAQAQDSTLPKAPPVGGVTGKLAKDGITNMPISQQGLYFKLDNGKLRPVSTITGLPTSAADGAGVDPFGSVRVSNRVGVWQNKNIQSKNDGKWEERTSGGGSSITFLPQESSVSLTVGTGATDFAVRQGTRYVSYVPKKGQSIAQTFVFPEAKTGVTSEVGYGDDLNGVFLQQADSTIQFLIRSDTSGAVAEAVASRDGWNLDKLDGAGPSGITLDPTKAQILLIDFQWLGVGRVRVGFNIDGRNVYAHEFLHANLDTGVFMRTPTLPVRYKIFNTEVTASATTLKEICAAVESEGGFIPPGLEFSALAPALESSWRTVTTRTPVFAIRLIDTENGLANRKTIRFVDAAFGAITNNAVLEVVHVHNPSAITATWSPVGGGSVVEYSTDITAITGALNHVIQPQLVVAGGPSAKGGGDEVTTGILNEHSFISQDFESDNSQVFVIFATATSGSSSIWSHITWSELN